MINKKRKPDTENKGKAKGKTKPETTQSEPVQEEHALEEKVTLPILEVTAEPTPTPEIKIEPPVIPEPPSKPKPPTTASLKLELDELRTLTQTLTTQMTDVQSQLALKRKPTANGKVQIRDKQTGKIYKSKNSVYQTMLKAGELKDLVDKKIFGDVPEKNTFGVYALFRAYPDRLEEVPEQEPEQTK
jgi:hypothetical protein